MDSVKGLEMHMWISWPTSVCDESHLSFHIESLTFERFSLQVTLQGPEASKVPRFATRERHRQILHWMKSAKFWSAPSSSSFERTVTE